MARTKTFKEEHPLGKGRCEREQGLDRPSRFATDMCDFMLRREAAGGGQAHQGQVSRQDPRESREACLFRRTAFGLCGFDALMRAVLPARQVIVEKAEKSDIPDIDKKKYVGDGRGRALGPWKWGAFPKNKYPARIPA